MVDHSWVPSKSKYGVAIYNFDGDVRDGLPLEIGETVHILEEFIVENSGWYRGFSLQSKGKKGIFPIPFVESKPCDVDNEGPYETVTPIEEPAVKEAAYVLREWSTLWKDLFVTDQRDRFQSIGEKMRDLIDLRRKLIGNALCRDKKVELQQALISCIDWGNGQFKMDLVPRIDGEQVDADRCSMVELYRVHRANEKLVKSKVPPRHRLMSEMKTALPVIKHLLLRVRNFGCFIGDPAEIYLSIYSAEEKKFISEPYLVRYNKSGVTENIDKREYCTALFTDLTDADMEKDLYLVARLYRLGRMLSEAVKKAPKAAYTRPYGVAVCSLKGDTDNLHDQFDWYTYNMKFISCMENNEQNFPHLHEQMIRKRQKRNDTEPSAPATTSFTVECRFVQGDMNTVKQDHPVLFNKGVTVVQKPGFADIITPGEVRNDFYVTLVGGEFDRGSKKAQKNIEVKVYVIDADGNVIPDCIYPGCGELPKSNTRSSVFYHSNSPKWSETIRLSLPMEKFPRSHIRFELSHCSTKDSRLERKLFAFCFLEITNKAKIVTKDGNHDLYVHKWDDRSKLNVKKYLELPSLRENVQDLRQSMILNHDKRFALNPREIFTVGTQLCSTKFTQNSDLLSILQWRDHKVRVQENLDKLLNLDGEEIVKFLRDILDALFDMFDSGSHGKKTVYENSVFQSLVHIFKLLQAFKFENFMPILDAYLSENFSAPLVHRNLLKCLIERLNNTLKGEPPSLLVDAFSALEIIMKFAVKSWKLQRQMTFIDTLDDDDEVDFHTNIDRLFIAMREFLCDKNAKMKSAQIHILSNMHKMFIHLIKVMTPRDLSRNLVDVIKALSVRNCSNDLWSARMALIHRMVESELFKDDDSRHVLLPLCASQIKDCLHMKIVLSKIAEVVGDVLDILFHLKQDKSRVHKDIQSVVDNLLKVIIDTTLTLSDSTESGGLLIACLTEILRLMDDSHYSSVMRSSNEDKMLKDFLIRVLMVFKELIKPEIFPQDWIVMRMATNNVIFTAIEYFSQALTDSFLYGDRFDMQLWSNYFNLAVDFVTQPSLQLEKYSEAKREKIKDRYRDMRVLMGFQLQKMWQSLEAHRCKFIPNMIGPFLEVTLVPEHELRNATLPIFFDMMLCQQRSTGHFNTVENEMMEKLDILITSYNGDSEYNKLFKKILLERVQAEPSLQVKGTEFIMSVTNLLERLLDYRQVMGSDENQDSQMYGTFNILNFYKDNINREELYVRYINKLYDLHLGSRNFVEAGLTLQLYAKLLRWGEDILPSEFRYPHQQECARKEQLYQEVIDCFDKGKVWEYGIPLTKELEEFYENRLEYKKLSAILQKRASFYNCILEGAQDEQTSILIPRQDPVYFRVAYHGKSFSSFVRNKSFVYRGDECLKLQTIINNLMQEYPSANIVSGSHRLQDENMNEENQYIQICSVKPMSQARPDLQRPNVPFQIRSFYEVNEVNTFQFDRPYHKGQKDKNCEFKTLCIERTIVKTNYKFPGILRWYEIISTEVVHLSPIQNAIATIQQAGIDLQNLADRCRTDEKLFFNQLEMKLQGMITAAVSGGMPVYIEAFLAKEYLAEHPEDEIHIQELRDALGNQVQIIDAALLLHGKLVPEQLRPLHASLMEGFEKLRKTLTNQSILEKKSFRKSDSGIMMDAHHSGTTGSGSSTSNRSSILSDISLSHDSLLAEAFEDHHPINLAPPPPPEKRRHTAYLLQGQTTPTSQRPQSLIVTSTTARKSDSERGTSRTNSDPALQQFPNSTGLGNSRSFTSLEEKTTGSPLGRHGSFTYNNTSNRGSGPPPLPSRRPSEPTLPSLPTPPKPKSRSVLPSDTSPHTPEIPEGQSDRPPLPSKVHAMQKLGYSNDKFGQMGHDKFGPVGQAPPLPPRKSQSVMVHSDKDSQDFNRFKNLTQSSRGHANQSSYPHHPRYPRSRRASAIASPPHSIVIASHPSRPFVTNIHTVTEHHNHALLIQTL
ncbi:hypothetical protein ScPMuIL_009568 [Solemya velum]